jgi:hypothetical protein
VFEKGIAMTNLDLASDRESAERIPSGRSWRRGVTLFLALSSTSIFNICHATAAPHGSRSAALSAAVHCACSTVEPSATTTVDVVRVDEDWELVVTEPDPNLAAPQIQTVMSPFQSLSGFYICFLVNHRNNPESAVGGLEVQFWYGDYQLGARRLEREELQISNETVSWTQRLMIKNVDSNPYICFRVVDGQSQSWGGFGGSEPLHMNLDTSHTNLSNYSSSFSIANSGVFFSSNRVARLVLKAVRGYDESGNLLFEESTPVVVYDGDSD